jgi:hypothetical protein
MEKRDFYPQIDADERRFWERQRKRNFDRINGIYRM